MWQARLVAVVVVMATAAAETAGRCRSLWRVLWTTRGVGAVLLAGAAVLFVVSASSVYTAHPFIYFRF
jgi:hypothetical protein